MSFEKFFYNGTIGLGIVGAVALAISYIFPPVEVVYDRFGACVEVIDYATSTKHDCGWEQGKRFDASYHRS